MTSLVASQLFSRQNLAVNDCEFLAFFIENIDETICSHTVSKRLIERFSTAREVFLADVDSLQSVEGMTLRAIGVFKFFELVHMRVSSAGTVPRLPIENSDALSAYLKHKLSHLQVEEFWVLYLDSKMALIRDEMIGRGSVDHCFVHPREIVRRALDAHASGIILVHNHPSRITTPSREDLMLTRRLFQITQSLDIKLHDHLIVAGDECISLRAMGHLVPESYHSRAMAS